jgi:hypothetical protein
MMRLAIALIGLASPVAAQTVTITDGDKIDIDGVGYRLLGVAAPDPHQLCDDGYPSGTEAIKTLRTLISGRRIACENHGREPSGRLLAICRADGRDLGEAMVGGNGMARSAHRPRLCRGRARCDGGAAGRARPRLRPAVVVPQRIPGRGSLIGAIGLDVRRSAAGARHGFFVIDAALHAHAMARGRVGHARVGG